MSFSVREVSWSAGGKLILDTVGLDVPEGATLGLIGPNGSGKSSLLKLLCRLRQPQGGVVTLGGEDLASLSRLAIAQRVAVVEQQAATLEELTVREVVALGRTPHRGRFSPWTAADEAILQRALDQVDLGGRGDQSWHTLSGGERQRVQIARALAQEPRELLLDEPTNHLDIQHQIEILALVERLPLTSIVALHDLNLAAAFCDLVLVLKAGRVVAAGPPAAVLTQGLLWEVFGVRAQIGRSTRAGRPHIQFLYDDPVRRP
jgi:iron complex transport system ATP-binding protein